KSRRIGVQCPGCPIRLGEDCDMPAEHLVGGIVEKGWACPTPYSVQRLFKALFSRPSKSSTPAISRHKATGSSHTAQQVSRPLVIHRRLVLQTPCVRTSCPRCTSSPRLPQPTQVV